MGCFNGCFSNCHTGCSNDCTSPDTAGSCCNAHDLCQFDGDFSKVVSEPIYVQKIYDAVMLNLQGLKTVSAQKIEHHGIIDFLNIDRFKMCIRDRK